MAAYRLAVVCDRLKTRARCGGPGPAVSASWSTRSRRMGSTLIPCRRSCQLRWLLVTGSVPRAVFPGDQDVPAGGARPGSAAVAGPGSEGLAGEFAGSPGVPGDGDAPAGQVEIIQREVPDRT